MVYNLPTFRLDALVILRAMFLYEYMFNEVMYMYMYMYMYMCMYMCAIDYNIHVLIAVYIVWIAMLAFPHNN